jgi:hypothetical protein
MALTQFPNIQTGDDYRDRNMNDLITAERGLRSTAERTSKELRSLLAELAFRFAGTKLEETRRTQPSAPDNWGPGEWRDFFASVVVANNASSWNGHVDVGALNVKLAHVTEERDRLMAMVSNLEKEQQQRINLVAGKDQQLAEKERLIQNLRAELRKANEQIMNNHNQPVGAAPAVVVEKPQEKPVVNSAWKPAPISVPGGIANALMATDESSTNRHPDDQSLSVAPVTAASVSTDILDDGFAYVEEDRFLRMVEDLTVFDTKDVPSAFRGRVEDDTPLKKKRQEMILYLVSRYGVSTNLELDRLLATAEKVRSRSNSIRTPGEALVRNGLMTTIKLEIKNPYSTSLNISYLTEDGKKLCRAWGWGEPVETDWERIVRLHQGNREEMKAHTLGMVVFAMHARFRGWTVDILPELPNCLTPPDMAVIRGREEYLVEFETGKVEKPHKWQNIAKEHSQGKVAVCTYTPEDTASQVADAAQMRLSGVATNLRSLIFSDGTAGSPRKINMISSRDELWYQHW